MWQDWHDWGGRIWGDYATQAPRKQSASELAEQLKWLLEQVLLHLTVRCMWLPCPAEHGTRQPAWS